MTEINEAFEMAKQDMFLSVHSEIYDKLTDKEREFVNAMAELKDIFSTKDVLAQMNMEKNYYSVYRKRLIDKGVVEKVSFGESRFSLPYMKEYVQQEGY
jgi:predicted transcriptional regulator of viral defense system